MQLGPLPEATEGPHIPEAGAKYATLKCPGGEKVAHEHTFEKTRGINTTRSHLASGYTR